jgi:hypothetical protein
MKLKILAPTLGVALAIAAPAAWAQTTVSLPGVTLTLSAQPSVSVGHPASYTVASNYSAGPVQALLVFMLPPGGGSCPANGTAPSNAVPLAKQGVDNYLSFQDLTSNLTKAGTWTVCAYLTRFGATPTAATSAHVTAKGSTKKHHHG